MSRHVFAQASCKRNVRFVVFFHAVFLSLQKATLPKAYFFKSMLSRRTLKTVALPFLPPPDGGGGTSLRVTEGETISTVTFF